MSRADDPLLDGFARLVRDRPDAPLMAAGEARLTASELERSAARVASKLRAAEIPAGAVVALDAANGPGFVAGLLALRTAGLAAVLLDRTGTADERRAVARRLGSWGIVQADAGWDTTPHYRPIAGSAQRSVEPDVAVIKLTSGSTGQPEGIVTPSAALVADERALASSMALREDERILAAVPLSHSYGLSSIVMPALLRGSTIVLPDSSGPLDSLPTLDRRGVTFLPTVPAFLGALVRWTSPPPIPPTVRRIITAGAPLTPEVATRFREMFGHPVHVFYGASECGGISYDREGSAAERGTVGTPVDGATIDLVDGAVAIRSPAVARGYLSADSGTLGDGRFVTGDLARFDGGELVLVGRRSDVINVRGRKVNPREIERVLSTMPAVDDAFVFGVDCDDGDQRVHAVVAGVDPDEIKQVRLWCSERLAGHKVPRRFLTVSRLPRTPRGKIDRPAVVRLFEADDTAIGARCP